MFLVQYKVLRALKNREVNQRAWKQICAQLKYHNDEIMQIKCSIRIEFSVLEHSNIRTLYFLAQELWWVRLFGFLKWGALRLFSTPLSVKGRIRRMPPSVFFYFRWNSSLVSYSKEEIRKPPALLVLLSFPCLSWVTGMCRRSNFPSEWGNWFFKKMQVLYCIDYC